MDKATPGYELSLDTVADRALITVEEAARILNLGRTAAYEAARRDEIPSRRVGRRVVVPVRALVGWLAGDVA
jgi:excisionase family DNA binding protein